MSYASLISYEKPNDIDDLTNYYFCDSRNFLVDEIEVFQITEIVD